MNIDQIKHNKKLAQILDNFIEVLRINIFIIDSQGRLLLASAEGGAGAPLTHDPAVDQENILKKYQWQEEGFWQYESPWGTHNFAIAIGQNKQNPQAFLVLGPVILIKKWNLNQYIATAQALNRDAEEFLDQINQIRIVTFNHLKSILDLLSELSVYALHLNQHKHDDILSPLLDIVLAITNLESGSIMLLNHQTGELTVKAFKGLNHDRFNNVSIKLGEGLAGMAALDNHPIVIGDTNNNNRIKHLLKRPEIAQSIIFPLTTRAKNVIGVLNLSTQKKDSRLAKDSAEIIKSLSELTSAAVENIA